MTTAAYQKEWYWRNRERVLQKRRERRLNDAEYRLESNSKAAAYRKERFHTDSEYRLTRLRQGAAYRKIHGAEQYQKNKEKSARNSAIYYQLHRDEIRERVRLWALAHPEKVRQYAIVKNPMRRAHRLGLPGSLTLEQWEAIKMAYKGKCAYCGKKSRQLTIDHVIPISQNGGTIPENIVPACKACNSRKRDGPPPIPVRLVLV